jgi:hypothetical protein
MSALGHKQTSHGHLRMSALPPKVDIKRDGWHVRFVPLADIGTAHSGTAHSITFGNSGSQDMAGRRCRSDSSMSRPERRADLHDGP